MTAPGPTGCSASIAWAISSNWHVSRTSPSRGSQLSRSSSNWPSARAGRCAAACPLWRAARRATPAAQSHSMNSGQCCERRRHRRPTPRGARRSTCSRPYRLRHAAGAHRGPTRPRAAGRRSAVSTQVAMMCSSSESLIIRWRSNSTIDSCEPLGCGSQSGERLRPAPSSVVVRARSPVAASFRAARGVRRVVRVASSRRSRVAARAGRRSRGIRAADRAAGPLLPVRIRCCAVTFVDHRVEAVVGAVSIDHVFVGGAVQSSLVVIRLRRSHRRPRLRRRRRRVVSARRSSSAG